jgi:hypothetical protein
VQHFRSLIASSFFYLNGDIRAYDGTSTATGTFRAVVIGGNKIPFEIQFIGKDDAFFWTEFNTKGATFASFFVYFNMAFQ